MWAFGGAIVSAGLVGLVMVIAEPKKGLAFIAGDQPVTEQQVRQKLQSEGWSDIKIVRDGRYLETTASKDGQTTRIAVDSQTGRLRDTDDDDDDSARPASL
jgi:hypothetical protein